MAQTKPRAKQVNGLVETLGYDVYPVFATYATKAASTAAFAGIPADAYYIVTEDESVTGSPMTRYRKTGGVAVLDANLDQLRTDLANPAAGFGADLVARSSVSFSSVTAARAFGPQTLINAIVITSRDGGVFRRDPTDTTSAENGGSFCGTIIRSADYATNGVWKRVFQGVGDFVWFGADPTGAASSAATVAVALASGISAWSATQGAYAFGTITGNTALFTLTSDTTINWNGSALTCAGQNTSSFTGTTLFIATDCRFSMWGYTFDDTAFLFAGPSRGVAPVVISSVAASKSGFSFGNFRVIRGQSLLTVASSNPALYRASNIRFFGDVSGGSCYYGVNLANNGDNFEGVYHVDNVLRLAFVYGLDGADIKATATTGLASSSNLNISCFDNAYQTKNVNIRARFVTIGGPCVIASISSAPAAVFENISIDLEFTANTMNSSFPVLSVGVFDAGGVFDAVERAITTKNIKARIKYPSGLALSRPCVYHTPSANHDLIEFDEQTKFQPSLLAPKNAAGDYLGPVIKVGETYSRAVSGDLTNAKAIVSIPAKFFTFFPASTGIYAELDVSAHNVLSFAKQFTRAKYNISAFLSGGGLINALTTNQIYKYDQSATVPVITIALNGGATALQITATAYTAATAAMVATVRPSPVG